MGRRAARAAGLPGPPGCPGRRKAKAWLPSGGAGGNGERLAVAAGTQRQQEGSRLAGPLLGIRKCLGHRSKTAFQHLGVNNAGVQGHAGHARGQFTGQCLRESFDGPFRRAIRSDFGRRGAAPAGTEIDDHALIAFHHGRDEVPDHVEHALDVDIDDARKLSRGNLPHNRVGIHQAGIIQQQIGQSELDQRVLGPGRDLPFIFHVDGSELMRRRELPLQLFHGLGRTTATGHVVSRFYEFVDQGAPQPAADAGDDDSLDFRHGLPSFVCRDSAVSQRSYCPIGCAGYKSGCAGYKSRGRRSAAIPYGFGQMRKSAKRFRRGRGSGKDRRNRMSFGNPLTHRRNVGQSWPAPMLKSIGKLVDL
jgi:hypothetical protein